MKPRVTVLLGALFLITAGLVVVEPGSTGARTQQELERALDIERYPAEPYQFISLKIGEQSVIDQIKTKASYGNHWGLDTVKFNEKDDWWKRVSVTMRNTSDKPVYGVQAFLYLKPLGYPMMFSLQLTGAKELWQEPLQPGAEIDLSVSERMLNATLENLKQQGADATNCNVSFSVDAVRFTKDSQWYRGKLLRPDPTTPHKWIPVN